jgi:hypothetical protein
VDKPCLDCDATVSFPEPGDATCPGCGLVMYLTDSGQVGCYPRDWVFGFQGRRFER